MQTRPSLRRSRRVAARDQGRVVNRVRQHGTRSNRHGRTSSSFPRSTTSRTSAREIVQGVINSTSGGPPPERASTAVEEGVAEDDGAPVSFSTPAPITADRLSRLTNTSITSQLYGDDSDTESEKSIAVGDNENSASAARNRHDATTSQDAAPHSTSTDQTRDNASTAPTPSVTALPNSIESVTTHGDPCLTSPPSQAAAPASTSTETTPGHVSTTSAPSLTAPSNSTATVAIRADPSSTSPPSQTAAPASTSIDPTVRNASTTSTPSVTAPPNSITTVITHGDLSSTSLPSQTAARATISGATSHTSTNAGGMNDLPIDRDVMLAVDHAIARQVAREVANGEDRVTSNTSHSGGAIAGSNSHGVVGGGRHLTPGGINNSAMPRRSYSSESSFDLSSDSEDSMPVPGASGRRNIEEIVISDTESQNTSNSQTIGRGMSIETLRPMLEMAIESVSDLICAEIQFEGNESEMLDPTFNTWPWKQYINPEVGRIAYDYFYKFHCPIRQDWLKNPVKLGQHYFSKSGIQGMCNRAKEQNMSYFWHPIDHKVEVPINRRFTVDLEYSNLVHKAQELCNQMNFRWITKVITARQMVMNNRNMVAAGGGESEGNGTNNQDTNIGNVADEPLVSNDTDAAREESSQVIVNESSSFTREVVSNRIMQEGEETINPDDLGFQLNNSNTICPNDINVTQSESESAALPTIPEGGIISTSTTTVRQSDIPLTMRDWPV